MSRRDVAKDMQRTSKWPRDVAEDDPVLGIPKLRRKEQHAIKGSPQSALRRKGKYSVGAVQGKDVTSSLNAPTNVLAVLMEKRPLNSVTTKNKVKAIITTVKYSAPDKSHALQFLQPPSTTLDMG